jgi:hypothetical protein
MGAEIVQHPFSLFFVTGFNANAITQKAYSALLV